jgi:hypothetical protein
MTYFALMVLFLGT